MIEKDTAVNATHNEEFYCYNNGRITRWRVSGKAKTWKTRPNEFRLPIKFGMYESYAITDSNAHIFYDDVQTAIAEHPNADVQKGLL